MFWRGREREIKDQNAGPPCGQVRVLVVGDSGNLINPFSYLNNLNLLVYRCCAYVCFQYFSLPFSLYISLLFRVKMLITLLRLDSFK